MGYRPIQAKLYAQGHDPNDLFSPAGGFGEDGKNTANAVNLKLAQTRKANVEAELKELELEAQYGKYLPRDAFREAATALLAHVAQGLRSLPDILERKHALPPEMTLAVQQEVDQRLLELADGLRQWTELEADNAPTT